MRLSPRKVSSWEVVDHRVVDPIFNDDVDLDLATDVSEHDIVGTYVFDVETNASSKSTQQALVVARKQLLNDIAKLGYNALLMEGWDVTFFRKPGKLRLEVHYHGRPARTSGNVSAKPPPFLEMLTSKFY